MPSLNDYRDLFRFTLEVPNASVDMLVTDLLEVLTCCPMADEDDYQYVKELLQEIARLWKDNKELERLRDRNCWPCHALFRPREFCSIGSFYVNDRQDLFNIFSNSHTFLDFDFDISKRLADLLRNLGCNSFLSDQVVIDTESREPLDYDHDLTSEFRGRADAIVKYAISSSNKHYTFHAYTGLDILSMSSASHLTSLGAFLRTPRSGLAQTLRRTIH